MAAPDLSLVHLLRRPARPATRPPLLILLHGVGSNERDLFALAPQLDDRFVIVSARAPNVQAPGSYAWFAVTFAPAGPVINPAQAEASRLRLLRFIPEACAAYGADPARVYLLGFSQGAIMSASVALTRPEMVAGAALLSGRILPEIQPQIAPAARLAGLPLLVAHGVADTVLPIQHGRASRAQLEALPVRLDYREYPSAHAISPDSLADTAAWLRARLDEPSRRVA